MRTYRLLTIFLILNASCVTVLADHTIQTKNESFSASGVESAILETGAGTLTITGMPNLSAIEVRAEFRSKSGFSGNAARILDNLHLNMEVRGNTFYLKSEQRSGWNWGDSGWIDLSIHMPAEIELNINDGSGSMAVSGMDRNIKIKDGSGEIELTGIKGNIRIDDGSGGIRIRNAQGDVDITDGSGSIDLKYLGGNVQIRDGSGSIRVDDVDGSISIPSDGSGDIRIRNAQYNVAVHDGSGSIDVEHTGGNVEIHDGSGSIDIRRTGGNVEIHDGSGSIRVNGVGGDLIIPSAGSGSLHYSDVVGRTNVPKR